jgi:hypothetical protein
VNGLPTLVLWMNGLLDINETERSIFINVFKEDLNLARK